MRNRERSGCYCCFAHNEERENEADEKPTKRKLGDIRKRKMKKRGKLPFSKKNLYEQNI